MWEGASMGFLLRRLAGFDIEREKASKCTKW
jgi:hypothetical protein